MSKELVKQLNEDLENKSAQEVIEFFFKKL